MPNRSTSRGVFVNCPFDPDYKEQFDALIFAIYDCGFYPRCAWEIADSGGVRFEKICELIQECRYGIHDLSRIEIDSTTQLPRFNMPLELGLFLGAKKFSGRTKRRKVCLVMDTERYRYRNFCSDLAGVDIEAHSAPRRGHDLTLSFCELFGRTICALFGKGVISCPTDGRASGAASIDSFMYQLQSVDLENSPHLRSKHGSEVERSRR